MISGQGGASVGDSDSWFNDNQIWGLVRQTEWCNVQVSTGSYLYSSSTILAGSACSIATSKNSSREGMNSLRGKKNAALYSHCKVNLALCRWNFKLLIKSDDKYRVWHPTACPNLIPHTCCLTCMRPCCRGWDSRVVSIHHCNRSNPQRAWIIQYIPFSNRTGGVSIV